MSFQLEKKEKIDALVNHALLHFASISDAEWNEKPQANKWSKKELLGHLIDSASNNTRRLVIGQYEQSVKIVYQQDEWVAYQNYQSAKVAELIALWKLSNDQLSRTIVNLPKSKLQYVCDTGKGEVKLNTLSFLIEDYIDHLHYHLKQLTA